MTEQPLEPAKRSNLEDILEHSPIQLHPDMTQAEVAQSAEYFAHAAASSGVEVDKHIAQAGDFLNELRKVSSWAKTQGMNMVNVTIEGQLNSSSAPKLLGHTRLIPGKDSNHRLDQVDFGQRGQSRLIKSYFPSGEEFAGWANRDGLPSVGRWDAQSGTVTHGVIWRVPGKTSHPSVIIGRTERPDSSTFDGIMHPASLTPITGRERLADGTIQYWQDAHRVEHAETDQEDLVTYIQHQTEAAGIDPSQTDVWIDAATLFHQESLDVEGRNISGRWHPKTPQLLRNLGRQGMKVGVLFPNKTFRRAATRLYGTQFDGLMPIDNDPMVAPNQEAEVEVVLHAHGQAPERSVLVIDRHTDTPFPGDIHHISLPPDLADPDQPRARQYKIPYDEPDAA